MEFKRSDFSFQAHGWNLNIGSLSLVLLGKLSCEVVVRNIMGHKNFETFSWEELWDMIN